LTDSGNTEPKRPRENYLVGLTFGLSLGALPAQDLSNYVPKEEQSYHRMNLKQLIYLYENEEKIVRKFLFYFIISPLYN
jgi:hypothetical protein